MSKEMIKFEHVFRSYGESENKFFAVNDVNFVINEGEFVVILGQSGAGKSTVLNMIGGIDSPTEGKITVNGKDVTNYTESQMSDYRAYEIGFVFQFYNLLTGLTAYENVNLVNEIVKEPLDPEKMLESVGLLEKKKKFPSQMSGGEQQRVSIARALAKNPPIILGDEPTGALDSETGKKVLKLMYDVCREHNKTLVIVTHNANIAQSADKVIRMKNAKIQSVDINSDPLPVEELEL